MGNRCIIFTLLPTAIMITPSLRDVYETGNKVLINIGLVGVLVYMYVSSLK